MRKRLPVILGLILAAGLASAAAPPTPDDPKKGVVVGNEVITCCYDGRFYADVFVHHTDKDGHVLELNTTRSGRSPVRWHVGYDAFWVSVDANFQLAPGSDDEGAGLARLDLPSLLTGKLRVWPREVPWHDIGGLFSATSPATRYRCRSHGIDPENKLGLHYDFLPFGKRMARQFVLTDVPDESYVPERVPARLAGDPTPEKKPAPFPWTFTTFRYEGRWDAKEKLWEERPWKKEGSISVAFKEPFQALALGDDYYFVTRSGSVFRAAKPVKGTDRTLARVWDGRLRPIKAFVSDAKTGKTFLFVPPAKEGGKRAFFELSDKPKLIEYDPKLVPLPPLEEPHRTIVHAARILVALKKIEGKPTPKAGEKKEPTKDKR